MLLSEILILSGPITYAIGWAIVLIAALIGVAKEILILMAAWAAIPWGCITQSGIGVVLMYFGM